MTDIRLDREYYYLHEKISSWCEEHFGPVNFYNEGNGRWSRDFLFGYQNYHFAEEADATFFTLVWVNK